MLKAGKASEAAKHLQQALDLKVSSTGLCWLLLCDRAVPLHCASPVILPKHL